MLWSSLYVIIERGLLGEEKFYPATGNPYEFQTAIIAIPIGGAIMGFLMGLLEVYFFERLFKKFSFGKEIKSAYTFLFLPSLLILLGVDIINS